MLSSLVRERSDTSAADLNDDRHKAGAELTMDLPEAEAARRH
jgi:hypothetical protein